VKNCFLITLIALSLVRPCAAQDTRKPTYTELFQAVWQTIDENFYDPSFGGVDWKAMRRKYQPEAAKVRDDNSFLALVYRMMRELRVSHLELSPPQRPRSGLGLRTRRVEGRSIITAVAVASDAQKQGLRVGDLLLTDPERLPGPIGTPAALRVRGCDGRARSLEVRRERAWSPPERPSIRWRVIEQERGRRIGYIKAVRFDEDAPPLIDAAMEDLKGSVGLIIDVRDNNGGNVSALRLVSYFTPGPRLGVALLSRPFLERLGGAPEQIDPGRLPRVSGVYTDAGVFEALKKNGGGAAFYTEDLGERPYRGKVIILVNERTASAAEGFAWVMKTQKAGTLIGQPTAGELLGGEGFDLPGGWKLTVPSHAVWGWQGNRYVDQPTPPDVEVKWRRRDLCEGRDPDIAKALELLSGGG
jgi:carboxyl-terminal processing protease